MINVCCRLLRDMINDDSVPLTYDEHIQEVQFFFAGGTAYVVVHFCPFCGAKLESGRSRLFTEPAESECEDVRQQLKGLKTLDEVIAQLGLPDDRGTGCGLESRPWKQWAVYREIWSSLILTVGEFEDGGLSWGLSGQPVDKKSLDS